MPKLITASYKQRKFVKEYLKTGNVKQSAMTAYNSSEKSAYRLGWDVLKQEAALEYMKRILDEAGMTDTAVANGLKAITEAGLSENSLKQAKPSDALKALDMTSKLRDLYPAEKKKIQKTTINANLENKSIDELKGMIDKLAEEAKTFSKLLGKDLTDAKIVP